MRQLRVFCVDDEPLALQRLAALLDDLPGVSHVGEASDGAAAVERIGACRPDLVLLDIELGATTGLEVAAALATLDVRVIFVTAYPNFALEAFGVAATDYLLKPVARARLAEALRRVGRELERASPAPTESPALWLRQRDVHVRVDAREIDWVEAEGDYVKVHTGVRSYLARKTLAEVQQLLGPDRFVRVHRSHLVRAELIRRVRNRGGGDVSIVLPTGHAVRVGRAYRSVVDELARF